MIQSEKARTVKHLLLRAGFGPTLREWEKFKHKNPRTLVDEIMRKSSQSSELAVLPTERPSLSELMGMSDEEKKMMFKNNRQKLKTLNANWVDQMATSEAQLREKMTFFWHDHFACRINQTFLVQQQNNTLRTHALGKFGDLLLAVSKDPAMLRFLNNQQNKKAQPNENFAREVLELFTMGRGNYTEKDISEAARAFTGWSSNAEGEFIFRKRQHDYGVKEFLGKRGNFDGDDILRIILEKRRTARFLTQKLYQFMVNPQVNQKVVDKWAKEFYESEYDITRLLETIFKSDHFYESVNLGARIKSPIEYLVGIMRMLNLRFNQDEGLFALQKLLGQTLFMPPNVAGWPEEKGWIDSSSMMARLKIPQALIFSAELNLQSKSSFSGNEDGIVVNRGLAKRLNATIDWAEMMKLMRKMNDKEVINWQQDYLLQTPSALINESILREFVGGKTREEKVKTLCMRIMTTPEFQLC
jgi:uncharacterized protein (DUF1800 family)